MQTVQENEKEFTKRDLKKAQLAQQLYRNLGRPSYSNFFHMLNNNNIQDCPITSEDVQRSLYIYRPDVGTLNGNTTRVQPAHIPTQHINPVPMNIRTFYRRVTLCVDLFYIA